MVIPANRTERSDDYETIGSGIPDVFGNLSVPGGMFKAISAPNLAIYNE